MVYADANIIVRYIINDDGEMSAVAEKAINAREFFILPEVFAEVVYVLTKVYKISRLDVSDSMVELLDFVSTENDIVMRFAFKYFRETSLDFVDCVLASHCLNGEKEILSFDKKLNNFIMRKKQNPEIFP